MELVYILVPIFVFVLLRGIVEGVSNDRAARLRLVEEALKNGADRNTVESLAWQVTGRKPPRAADKPGGRMMALLLALGWFTLFAGIGIWVLGRYLGQNEASGAGILVSIVGFGLVTYPFALRELESRRPAQ